MIKTIVPGNFRRHRITCWFCECIFEYTSDDDVLIEDYSIDGEHHYGCCVECPECGRKNKAYRI